MLSKFLDRQGPGHRAGTFVNVIKAASLPSKGTALIVASHQPHKGLPLLTAMLRCPATLLSEGQVRTAGM